MPYCFAPGCNHVSRRDTCSFFRFPSDAKIFSTWKNLCRRKDRDPSKEDRLCSCHFINGDKKNAPSIFAHSRPTYTFPSPPRKSVNAGSHCDSHLNDNYDEINNNNNKNNNNDNEDLGTHQNHQAETLKANLNDNYQEKAASEDHEAEACCSSHLEVIHENHKAESQNQLKEEVRDHGKEVDSNKDLENYWRKAEYLINESEINNLRKENEILKQALNQGESRLSFENLKSNIQVFQYTGLPTAAHFQVLVDLVKRFEIKYFMGWNVRNMNIEDQLLCTLMKLRLNLQFFDLAFRFKISHTAVHNIFVTFVHVLYEVLYLGMMNEIPSREKNKIDLPMCFAGFPNIRIILDCTEVEIAIPSSLTDKKHVFSHYKQRHTYKVLIGIAPNATITYLSDMYPGSTSDKAITRDSGILSHMKAGDLILCDKGFLISDLCTPLGVNVNIPPFLSTGQFSKEEVLATRKIARSRIHVERAISRLKSFRILDFITPNMKVHASIIIKTCAALVNMQYALLKENEQCFNEENDGNEN